MPKTKQTYAEHRSQQMRQAWIDKVKQLAQAVDNPVGVIQMTCCVGGPKGFWADEMSLQWHAYNAGCADVRRKHKGL